MNAHWFPRMDFTLAKQSVGDILDTHLTLFLFVEQH